MGRNRISETLRRSRSLSLTDDEHNFLKKLGKGSASSGMRFLIGLYNKIKGIIS